MENLKKGGEMFRKRKRVRRLYGLKEPNHESHYVNVGHCARTPRTHAAFRIELLFNHAGSAVLIMQYCLMQQNLLS